MRTVRWILLAVLIGAVGLLAGCFGPLSLTEAHDGDLVDLKVGDEVIVRLTGNPTTGYAWLVADSLKETVLESLGDGVFVPGTDAPAGGGGHFEFRFRAVAIGTTPLELSYRRTWEDEALETFAVAVIVR